MKILHIIPRITTEASGPSYTVPALASAQSSLGADVHVSCQVCRLPRKAGVAYHEHGQLPVFTRLGISPAELYYFFANFRHFDIIHVHSLWALSNLLPGYSPIPESSRIVVSPRGTLSHWSLSHHAYRKRLLYPFQYPLLARTSLFIATAESEVQDIRNLGFTTPATAIPNGIHIPNLHPRPSQPSLRRLLFLSRIHPKKGLELLLSVWSNLQDSFQEWELIVAGTGDSTYLQLIKNLSRQLGNKRVKFMGPVFGHDKNLLYQSAELFVLPTESENFGIVVAEALSNSCPVVVTNTAPWAELDKRSSGWCIDRGSESLSQALRRAMSMSSHSLRRMGFNGRMWMQSSYSWASVASSMLESYSSI